MTMDILYLKLKNGNDLIANTTINNGIATLEKPVSLRYYSDSTGKIALTFSEWIPLSVVSDTIFKMDMNEVLIVCNASSSMKNYYKSWTNEDKNLEENANGNDQEATAYQSILQALTTNKKLLH